MPTATKDVETFSPNAVSLLKEFWKPSLPAGETWGWGTCREKQRRQGYTETLETLEKNADEKPSFTGETRVHGR